MINGTFALHRIFFFALHRIELNSPISDNPLAEAGKVSYTRIDFFRISFILARLKFACMGSA